MSDYIKREDVLTLIDTGCLISNSNYNKEIKLINELPSADVEPVRHGRWIKHYECCDAFVCSECGTPSIVTQNYCCNCGAKMDGEE